MRATSFAIGDKVVLEPVAVMTITAIGTRRSLTPPGMENVDVDFRGVMQGSSALATFPANDKLVYALRFVGDARDSMLLDVAAAEREGLRHISTPSEIDEFLRTLKETAAVSRTGARKPQDLARATMRARSDLKKLATLYPFLAADPHDQWYSIESDQRRQLRTFFVDEIAVAKDITKDRAATLLDDALR